MENLDPMKVVDRIIADIQAPKRFRRFVSLANLEKKEGSLKKAKFYRTVACDLGLANRRNEKNNRPGGMIWTDEALKLRRKP
jgi:hypothetical protein